MKPNLFVSRSTSAALALTLTVASMVPAHAGLLKADSEKQPTPFIEHPRALARDAHRPLDKIARNSSRQAWERVRGFDRIAILPVNTHYLHTRNGKPLPARDVARAERMAQYLRASLQKEFANGGTYRVVTGAGHKTLTLELALVELRPTNVPINVVSTGASVVVPGANFVGSIFSKGGIAIEGKLRNGETGELLEEFSDREQDKTSLFSFRDYTQYAHGRRAADDWSREIEKMSRTPRDQKIHTALAVTLNPF